MLDLCAIKDGETYWMAYVEFAKSFRCIRNTRPTQVIAERRNSGGFNLRTTDGKLFMVVGSRGARGDIYLTEEEAVEYYNSTLYLELDRLQYVYETTKKNIENKIIKKKEDI